jgi:hypothetical protein
MNARDMALYKVRVTFMQEHREWVAHDESRHTGWREHTDEYHILAKRHYQDEGHAAIRFYFDDVFRHHGKPLPDGSKFRLEIMPNPQKIDALVEFRRG